MRILIAAAVFVSLPACSAEPEVEFVETPLSAQEWDAWSHAGVQSAHQEITIRRTMRTPSACRTLDAGVVRVGDEITLRVMAQEAEEDDCDPGREGLFGYLAVIRGLRPGSYDLRVVHVFATPGRPTEEALRHRVLVEP